MGQIVKEIVPTPPKECCSTRDVLWYLVFVGFAVNYMLRINLNMIIVSMVHSRPSSNISITSECIPHAINSTLYQQTSSQIENSTSRKFFWNEKEQSMVLGSFFWLHWTTQVPGGMLASKYGTKKVFGFSNLAGVLCVFLVPPAAYLGATALIVLRVIQGFVAGFAWPSMHNMTARWVPPNERSKFVTAYLGSSVGAALTYPICGFIMHYFGWEAAFYVCGVAGVLWFIAWWFLVYDSPANHPRISPEEKEYIISSLGQSYSKEKAPVPWKSIFLSVPVWTNIIAQGGGVWGFFTLMTQSPTYFKFIHGWSIQATGLLAGLGHILRTTWSYISGQIGDYLLRTNRMSRTNVRKLATAGCTIVQGICMIGLAFSGCSYIWAVIWLSAAVAANGSVSTGPLASIVDISPNYASVILGIVNGVAAIVGFITAAVVGQITFQNQTIDAWQTVFIIATTLTSGPGLFFVLFNKSELEPWNSPDQKHPKESELISINSHTVDEDEEIKKLNESNITNTEKSIK